MALPSSGTLTLQQIYDEAVAGGYSGAKSLSALSLWDRWYPELDTPLPPHQISKFYGREFVKLKLSFFIVNESSEEVEAKDWLFGFHLGSLGAITISAVGMPDETIPAATVGNPIRTGFFGEVLLPISNLAEGTTPTSGEKHIHFGIKLGALSSAQNLFFEIDKIDSSTYTIEAYEPSSGTETALADFQELEIDSSVNFHYDPEVYNSYGLTGETVSPPAKHYWLTLPGHSGSEVVDIQFIATIRN